MPKNVPKKAPAKAEAAATATVAAPKEWTDLEVAAQLEVAQDGSVINPFTKEVIAKGVGGLLDVRRPGGAKFPKPENVAVVGSVSETFAKWFMEKCQIAAVTAEEVSKRFGIEFIMPDIEVDVAQTPYAFVTATLGKEKFGFHIVNSQVSRVGKRTERGYVWAISEKFLKARGNMCPRSTRGDAQEVFKCMMGSFVGKLHLDAPVAAAKPKATKTPPAKAPTKTVPKKVPAKK